MKIFLALSVALAAVSSVSAATVTPCGSTSYTQTALAALTGQECEVGDKIFSNFGGNMDTVNPNLEVNFNGGAMGPYNVTIADVSFAALTANFTFSYTVTVDESSPIVLVGTENYISSMSAGGQDSTGGSAANNNTTNNAGCATLNSVDSGSGFVSVACNTTGAPTSLAVAESYAYTSGSSISSIQDTYFQGSFPTTGTPEPGSMMLLGSGLLAAGLIGRKKLAGRK